jgi:predicted transcriptional regulator
MMTEHYITSSVTPLDNLDVLSPYEVARLQDKSQGGLYNLFRQCALAVLNCGSEMDSTRLVLDRYREFDVQISQKHRGVQLDLINAPASAFVDTGDS